MVTEQMLAFMLFAIVAAITPGPSNVILTSTGANIGILRGIPSLFGVVVGMGIMMFMVAFGLGSLVLANPLIIQILKWCGACFLLWLAWKIASAGYSEPTSNNDYFGFWRAAAFQWVNPKSWLVCVSAAGTYLQNQAGSAFQQSFMFGLLFILAALPSCFVWLAFGATIQRLLRTERIRRIFHITMGLFLAGSVILFVY